MIHLITGCQGSGKTLFLVKLAHENFINNRPVYSNVFLKFKHEILNYNDIIQCKYSGGVVIIDEVHLLLSSRRSMSKINREICDGFLSMVRKKNLDVYATTQKPRKVDIRFYEEADYFYHAEKFAFIKGRWIYPPDSKNLSKDVPIMVKLTVVKTDTFETKVINFIANPYFDMFDSSQIINVEGI